MNFFVHDYRTVEELRQVLASGQGHPRIWRYRGGDLTVAGWYKVYAPNPPANHTWSIEVLLDDRGRVTKTRNYATA